MVQMKVFTFLAKSDSTSIPIVRISEAMDIFSFLPQIFLYISSNERVTSFFKTNLVNHLLGNDYPLLLWDVSVHPDPGVDDDST